MRLLRRSLSLGKHALAGWWNDNVPRLGASLAYYTLFAIAPVLVIAIAIAGLVYGGAAVRGEVVAQVRDVVGPTGARGVQMLLEGAGQRSRGVLATVLGGVTFLITSTGAFLELQAALNNIWRVKPKPGVSVRDFLLQRLVSFALVIAVGFLLLVSLLVSAALAALGRYVSGAMPGWVRLAEFINLLISLGVVTVLFGLLYKVLPDVQLRWRDVWVGGAVTAVLFTIGKFLIGLYLGRSGTASTYGAAGSVVVLLLWVYYAAQIVLLGAEFTRVYTAQVTGAPPPAPHATDDPDAARDPSKTDPMRREADDTVR